MSPTLKIVLLMILLRDFQQILVRHFYIRASKKGQPTSILLDNEIETDPTKIAEGFNAYFSSIAEKLQQNSFGGENFTKYLSRPFQIS